MISYADRVLETTLTSGTGSYSLAGAPTNFRSVVDGVGTGKKVAYHVSDDNDWESGIGTITAGTPDILSRDDILESSNAGAAVSWGSNAKTVRVAPLAKMFLSRDEKLNDVSAYGASGGTGNAHTLTFSPVPLGYSDGEEIVYYAPAANTGAVNVNKNSLGNKELTLNGVPLTTGQIPSGVLITARYKAADGKYHIAGGGIFAPVSVVSTAVSALLAGFKDRIFSGLSFANNVSDATNDIDIAAGACMSDDGTTVMSLSAVTKQLDVAWAVGSVAGGRDTGSITDGTWHLWVIHRPDTGVTDLLFSLSATAPTLPANYTKKKRIGAVYRDSGVILPFIQSGKEFWLKTPLSSYNATSSTSASLLTLKTPAGVKTRAILNVSISGGTNNNVYLSDPAAADLAVGTTIFSIASGTGENGGQVRVVTDTTPQIRHRSNGSTAERITLLGWEDFQI